MEYLQLEKKFAAVFGCCLLISFHSSAQLPPSDSNYKLVFHDEFDNAHGSFPVNDKWWSRTQPWNQKSNYTENVAWCFPDTSAKYWDRAYTMKDRRDTTTVKVSNGTCKLLTNKTPYPGQVSNWPPCDPERPGYSITGKKCMDACGVKGTDTISRCWTVDTLSFRYTSGSLCSRQKFRRGYFELRFKLPASPAHTQQGFGPNFWLWGNKPPVNWYGEIDIFEIIAFNPLQADTNRYTSTVYYSDKNVTRYPKAHTEVVGNKLKNDSQWHTASAWWTDTFIKFYLDDSLYYTVQEVKEIAVDKLEEMFIILDINSPLSGRCNNFDAANTRFPYVFELDYVRVYQLK